MVLYTTLVYKIVEVNKWTVKQKKVPLSASGYNLEVTHHVLTSIRMQEPIAGTGDTQCQQQKSLCRFASKHLHCCALQHLPASPTTLVS